MQDKVRAIQLFMLVACKSFELGNKSETALNLRF